MAAKISKRFNCLSHWTLEQRLDRYIDRTGGPDACWPWTGARDRGYGKIGWKGRTQSAYRLAWEVVNGPIPPGLCVLHRCDNPPCCNPAHLWCDTHRANMADRDAKGRVRNGDSRGVSNGRAKLTEADVRAIRVMRRTGASYKEICAQFNIGKTTVGHIVHGTSWRHLA